MVSFDTNWWETFFEKTAHLKMVGLFENAANKDIEKLNQLTHQLFQSIHNNHAALPWIRVFVDSGLRKDLPYKLIGSKIKKNENIDDWVKRTLGKVSYSIVFNNSNIFSEGLTQKFASYLYPFYSKLGIPTKYFHVTLFIGNYSNTPFGVHLDPKGLKAIHVHLGPGKKKMLLWEPKQFKNLNCQLIENMDPKKLRQFEHKKYTLKKSDVFYLPVDEIFHIGNNVDDYSVALSIGIENAPLNEIIAEHINGIVKAKLNVKTESRFIFDEKFITDKLAKTVRNKLSGVLDDETSHATVYTVEDRFLSRLSNMGFDPVQHQNGKQKTRLFNLETIIVINKPFNIYYGETPFKNMNVYARGVVLRLSTINKNIIALIDALNKGDEVHLKPFLDHEKYDNKNDEFQNILSFLEKTYAIKRIK